jgi:hypothetical protein
MTPESKKQTVKKAYDLAFVYAPRHHSCSLGTLLALQEAFEIKEENVFKAASGLHGGIGRKRDICGSFLGSSLMLGMLCGSSIAESGAPNEHFIPEDLDTPTRLVGELYDWFGTEFGAVKCAELLKKHIEDWAATPDAKKLTQKETMDKLHDKCNILCAKTAAKAAELLWDELHDGK